MPFFIENEGDIDYFPILEKFLDISIKTIKLGSKTKRKNILKKALYFMDQPFDLGSVVPQYLLAKEIAKRGYNVAISGDGADELFGGYSRNRWFDCQKSDIFDEIVYYHLPRLDTLMYSHCVELRCPYLAKSIISVALNVPYVHRTRKEILRLIEIKIPEEIRYRKKTALRIEEAETRDYRKEVIETWLKVIKRWY